MKANNASEQTELPIRVLIANMSGIVLEIVMQALEKQPDMTVQHYGKDLAGLALAVGYQTNVLIWGAPNAYPPPAICRQLWKSFPALKIFVLSPSADSAVMYWLNVRRHRLRTISVEELVHSIRRVHRIDLTAE